MFSISISSRLYSQYEQKFTLQLASGYVFNGGVSFDAGVQYNFSRTFSTAVLIKYTPIQVQGDLKLHIVGINICPKYIFFPQSKINPFILGGVGINYYSFKIPGASEFQNKEHVKLGLTGALGLDFRASDNIAIFLQGGINAIQSADANKNFYTKKYITAGVNISMFKSRTL